MLMVVSQGYFSLNLVVNQGCILLVMVTIQE